MLYYFHPLVFCIFFLFFSITLSSTNILNLTANSITFLFPFRHVVFPVFIRNASFRLIFFLYIRLRRIQITSIWTKLQNSTVLCLICAVPWRVVRLHRDAIYLWKEIWDLKTTLAKWVCTLIAVQLRIQILNEHIFAFFLGGRSLLFIDRYATRL